jgi:hypothetical protein
VARFKTVLACIFIVAMGVSSSRTSAAGPIQVNSTAIVSNPSDGLCTLPEAMQSANLDAVSGGVPGECAAGTLGLDTILLPAGTYTLTAINNVTASASVGLPVIRSPIEIAGASAATTIVERAETAPDLVIFYVEFTGSTSLDRTGSLTLNRVTVRNGRWPTGRGGAVTGGSALTTIIDSVFSGNSSDWGGAVYMGQGSVIVRGSRFEGNSAKRSSGALYGHRGVIVENSVFESNRATEGGTGAVGVGAGHVLQISDSSFLRNEAVFDGGAAVGPTVNVTRSWFHGNRARSGGAVQAFTLNMSHTTVSDNTATELGGGVVITATGGALGVISDSTFTGNKAHSGGGIAGDLKLTNVTVSGNQAVHTGGGIWVNGHFTGNNVTITNNALTNSHSTAGGGAHFVGWQPIFLANSVIAGNFSGVNGRAPDCYSGRNVSSQGHNLIGNACECPFIAATGDLLGTFAAPIDPRLGALQTNGGITATHLPLTGSLVVDTASALAPGSDPTACAVADQRGTARPVDGDGDLDARSDRGAVEADGNPFPSRPAFSTATYNVDETAGAATITVRRDDPTGEVGIAYAATAGSATAAGDFNALAGTLLFLDGEAEKTFAVPILDDTALEGSESIRLALRAVGDSADVPSYSTAILFITDDDSAAIPSAADVALQEGTGATTTHQITVSLTRSYTTNVSVAYKTIDGEAVAGSDYEAATGTLVFSPGQTSKTIPLRVTGDTVLEDSERLTLQLRTTAGCSSVIRTATITIVDDEIRNRVPSLANPGTQTNAEGASVTLALSADDADDDALTFTASGLPSGLSIDASTGAIGGTLPYDAAGDYSVSVTVDDGHGATMGVAFTWTVTNTNRVPALANPGPQTNAEGQLVAVTLGATDADGDGITFGASGLPPGLSIDTSTGTVTGTLPFTAAGLYNVTVTVDDGSGGTASASFAWTVTNTNRVPALANPGSQTSQEGQPVTLALAASDPDADALTFTADGLPAGLSVGAATGIISGTIASGAAGSYSVTVVVSDGHGGSASVSFAWTVPVPNHAPSCATAAPTTSMIWPPNHKLLVPIGITIADPDGDDVTIVVTAILQDEPTNVTGDGATPTDAEGVGTAVARVRAERSGSPRVPGNGRFYEIQFRATDSRGASCTGFVLTAVPHDRGKQPVDDVIRYDSTVVGGGRVR